ncbi:LAETG motif-containing sortase-dependent surface protein [Streptomyces sp. NPDC047017]|uniref:LAETG motif-containing sortase-dependent surface protein n=1 Tax=Streptomyces sp. NPDC047017 TaxID=3155024 RepID=UPI0033FFE01C
MSFKRAATAAAVASAAATVLLASGSAHAGSISDFTAKATCDTSTGEARAAITVTDKDPSGTPADIIVRRRMAVGSDGETLGTGRIEHPTAAGGSTTVLVPWVQGYQWNIYVTAGDLHEELLTNLPISPDTPCVVTSTHPSSAPSGPASSTPPTTTAPTATATPTSSAAAPVTSASSVPSASPSSSSASGGLAETGGGSNSALIGGAAVVVIAVGAGVLVAARRRTAVGRH